MTGATELFPWMVMGLSQRLSRGPSRSSSRASAVGDGRRGLQMRGRSLTRCSRYLGQLTVFPTK